MQNPDNKETLDQVRQYYGSTLKSSENLQTSACSCSTDSLPSEAKAVLPLIADEILNRFYGCGSPLPPLLEGCTVLDLGCGTGRDSFIASKLVGAKGKVIGVDMTREQIEVARRYENYQAECFGYSHPNTTFLDGYIEDLASLGIEDESVDVVISNCVINLSPAKKQLFKEIFRVLKPGGELYFSDIFADRRIPAKLSNDPVLRGECLGGALYIEDFRRLLLGVGCQKYCTVANRAISLGNDELKEKLGPILFSSCTIRTFKLTTLEDICEDYGQSASYLGTIPDYPDFFDLDNSHRFFKGEPLRVCGNTASMLSETRYASSFRVEGDRSVHHGAFDCSGDKNNDAADCCAPGCC